MRIRQQLDSATSKAEWVEELEDAEEAVVAETLANQQAVDRIVAERLELFAREKKLDELPALKEKVEALTSQQSFDTVLRRFAKRTEREDYLVFWEDYGVKFRSKPESLGKALLGTFLEGYCRGQGFVCHEIKCGEGFVDVLVFFNGRMFVLELKVLGGGWSMQKAKLGLSQLNYYDQLYEESEVFLIVFDGRKTKSGEQFDESITIENGKEAKIVSIPIYSIAPTRTS